MRESYSNERNDLFRYDIILFFADTISSETKELVDDDNRSAKRFADLRDKTERPFTIFSQLKIKNLQDCLSMMIFGERLS